MRKVKPHFRLALATLLALPWLLPFAPAASADPQGQLSQEDLEFIAQQGLVPETNPNHLFFVRRERNTTAVVDRPATYDFQTSPLLNPDGTKDIYYCGGTGGHDHVLRATLSATNVLLDGPVEVIAPSKTHFTPDGEHACDVSVIRHSSPGLTWPGGEIDSPEEELLYLYYECGSRVVARGSDPEAPREMGGPSEICVAASADNGATWMKHSTALATDFGDSTTIPTQVVAMNEAVKNDICGWADGEAPFPDKYVVDLSPPCPPGEPDCSNPTDYQLCDNLFFAYGSGHPSAISMPTEDPDQREIWLFYYDSRGDWDQHGMALVKSDDGLDFGAPIDLWVIDPATGLIRRDSNNDPLRLQGGKIRYYDVEVAGHQGVFIATDAYYLNYFSYSFDGIHWVAPRYGSTLPDPKLRLGEVRSDPDDLGADLCVSPGAQGVLADKYGWVDRLTNVELFVGEGKLANDHGFPVACEDPLEEEEGRGYTWAIYAMKGDFGELIHSDVADACDHFDGKNVRSELQRNEDGGPQSTQNTIWWVENGERYEYADWADFLAKNGNDPYAYFDVSAKTFERIKDDCDPGGIRVVPAVAVNDSATLVQTMSARIRVLDNDTGPINAATVVQVTAPSNGFLAISGAGVITYNHNGNASATSDSFSYKVKDTSGVYSNVATVSVTMVAPSVLHRVNAGGPALSGDWTEDRTFISGGIPSSRSNAAATSDATYAVSNSIDTSGIPSGIPADLFKDQRFDGSGSAPEMTWSFPVNAGQMVEARLFFAENFYTGVGQRVFSVSAEGSPCTSLQNFDILAQPAGARYKAVMRTCRAFVTDGKLDLVFTTVADAPVVNGIEILGLPLVNVPPVANADSAISAQSLGATIPVLANDVYTLAAPYNTATLTIVNPATRGNASVSGRVINYVHTGNDRTADRFSYVMTDSKGVVSNTGVVTVTVKSKVLLYRINAGGSAQTQLDGDWSADTWASPSTHVNYPTSGNTVYSTNSSITAATGVPLDTNLDVFKSCRFDVTTGANMIWSFPISTGAVPHIGTNLYFAEIFYGQADKRKFGVKIEGATVLNEYDIFAAAGGDNRGKVERSQRSVTDGTLNIEFVPGSKDSPQVNAIEIFGPAP